MKIRIQITTTMPRMVHSTRALSLSWLRVWWVKAPGLFILIGDDRRFYTKPKCNLNECCWRRRKMKETGTTGVSGDSLPASQVDTVNYTKAKELF